MREPSGPHPIPPLALPPPPPERGSDPPVSSKGASWKVIGVAIGFLFSAASTAGTVLYTAGVDRAEQRAQVRGIQERLNAIQAGQRVVGHRLDRNDTRIAAHDTQIEVVRHDIAAIQREIEEERREARE